MSYCATCKYWEKLPIATKYGECAKVSDYDITSIGMIPEEPAFIDTDGDCGGFITLPTFGCIIHEVKP